MHPSLGANVPTWHGTQVAGLPAEQGWASYDPAAHAEHATQCPPSRYEPSAHVVQSPDPGPEQVAQLASHAEHCASDVAVQAVA
jgi:hypothetical protein